MGTCYSTAALPEVTSNSKHSSRYRPSPPQPPQDQCHVQAEGIGTIIEEEAEECDTTAGTVQTIPSPVPPPPGTTPRLTISKAGTQGAPAVGLWGNVAGRAIRRAYNRAGIAGVRKGRAIATARPSLPLTPGPLAASLLRSESSSGTDTETPRHASSTVSEAGLALTRAMRGNGGGFEGPQPVVNGSSNSSPPRAAQAQPVLGGWGMGPGQTGGGVGAGAVLSQGVCDDDEGDGVWLFPGGRGKPIAQARPPHLQITRKVASGGFGTVFEGLLDESLPVAVKILTFNDLPSVPQQPSSPPQSTAALPAGHSGSTNPGLLAGTRPQGGGGSGSDPGERAAGEAVSRRRATGAWETGASPGVIGKGDGVTMVATAMCGLTGPQGSNSQPSRQQQQLLPAWMGGAESLGTKAAQMAVAEVAVSGMATHPNLVPCYAMSVRSVSVPGRQGSSWEGGRQGAVIYEVRLVMAWCDRGDLRSLIHSGGLLLNRKPGHKDGALSYTSSSTGNSPNNSQGTPGVLSSGLASPVASGSGSSGSSNNTHAGQREGSPLLLSGGEGTGLVLATALRELAGVTASSMPDLRTKSLSHDGSIAPDAEAEVVAMQRRESMPSIATTGGVLEKSDGDEPCIGPTRPLLLPPASPGGTSSGSYAWGNNGITSENSGAVTTVSTTSSTPGSASSTVRNPPPSQPQADMLAILLTALDVARGINSLHKFRIVHTDLKPGNVLISSCKPTAGDTRGWVARVGDYGLSVRLPPGMDMVPNTFHGTPAYQAPEVRQHGRVCKASDVFSFGCCLHEMATTTRAPPCEVLHHSSSFARTTSLTSSDTVLPVPSAAGTDSYGMGHLPPGRPYQSTPRGSPHSAASPALLRRLLPHAQKMPTPRTRSGRPTFLPGVPLEFQQLVKDMCQGNLYMRPTMDQVITRLAALLEQERTALDTGEGLHAL